MQPYSHDCDLIRIIVVRSTVARGVPDVCFIRLSARQPMLESDLFLIRSAEMVRAWRGLTTTSFVRG